MLDRQALIDGTKKIQHNMQKIDLKFLSPQTIAELADNIRGLAAIVEVVVNKTILTY